jgi:hypothetical protein
MRHMVIPDTQVKPGVNTDHLGWAGKYAVAMKPDVIVMIGDWWDMASLSSYDKGTKSFEGRRYIHDIQAGNRAMDQFMAPIMAERKRLRHLKKKQWNPRLVFTLGNHENRITRAVEKDAMLEEVIGYKDFNLEDYGWEVHDFLDVVTIDGVCYSHFFTSGVMGRPVTSARALLTKKHQSCVMGHVQDRDIAFAKRADGRHMTGLFAGIFYQHQEDYLTPQTNGSWSGLWILNEVEEGEFDELPVSMRYLEKRYGG